MVGASQASCAPWKCTHNLSLVEPEALGFGFRSRAPQGIGMHRWLCAYRHAHIPAHHIIYNSAHRAFHIYCLAERTPNRDLGPASPTSRRGRGPVCQGMTL